LVFAAYENEIQRVAVLAPELLAAHPPQEALRLWLDRLAYYGRLKYGVAEIVHAASSGSAEREAYDLVIGALGALLEAGTRSGDLKPDLVPDDVLLMVSFLWRLDPTSGPEDRAARMLDLVMDGLAATPPTADAPAP
jgi:hypothetical protein